MRASASARPPRRTATWSACCLTLTPNRRRPRAPGRADVYAPVRFHTDGRGTVPPTPSPTSRLLFRSDVVTVRESVAVEPCATRHQIVFTRSRCTGPRVHVAGLSPETADPTRVLLVNAGETLPGRRT